MENMIFMSVSRVILGILTAKVMFLQVCVILFTGQCIPACIAGGIPACLAAGLQGGVCSWGVSAPRRVSALGGN